MTIGAYTEFRELTAEEIALFEELTSSLIGATYTPLLVATQVVAGVNYKFRCKIKPIYPEVEEYEDDIIFNVPLNYNAANNNNNDGTTTKSLRVAYFKAVAGAPSHLIYTELIDDYENKEIEIQMIMAADGFNLPKSETDYLRVKVVSRELARGGSLNVLSILVTES